MLWPRVKITQIAGIKKLHVLISTHEALNLRTKGSQANYFLPVSISFTASFAV